MDAKRTPLTARLIEMGARTVPYAGYEMPVRFGAIKEEHQCVRTKAGLFDVSHMSEFWFEGKGALASVNRLLTNDLTKAGDGDLQYTLMCTESGGVVDDLIVYRYSAEKLLLVMNAACHDQDVKHIEANLTGDVTFTNRSQETAQLALQGPNAVSILAAITDRFTDLKTMTFVEGEVAGVPCIVSRSGYTGEDGYELYCPNDGAVTLLDALVAAGEPHGLQPIGLGARDTLRLEAKLPLYGNELDFDTSPLQARLGWTVALDKDDFIGKEALQRQKAEGLGKKLLGFEMIDKGIGRHGYSVVNPAHPDTPIGQVTSGAPSPTLGTNIGLAYLPEKGYKSGVEIGIDIRGKIKAAKIVKTPFYKRPR